MKSIYTQFFGMALLLSLSIGLASAQISSAAVYTSNGQEISSNASQEQVPAEQVWRFSHDQKFYTISYAGGLHIRPVNTGHMTAEVPLTTNKKGKSKLEGHWAAGASGGLLVIQKTESGFISGNMLVPADGIAAFACSSRKNSIIFSFGQSQPICTVEAVTWTLVPNISVDQAAQEEMQQFFQAVSVSAAQPSDYSNVAAASVDPSYVGTWSNETSSAVSYAKTRLELRADGTYTKTLAARPATMGGGVVGAGSLGDTHSGTWSVAGSRRIQLSGDARHQPYLQDISTFTRQ